LRLVTREITPIVDINNRKAHKYKIGVSFRNKLEHHMSIEDKLFSLTKLKNSDLQKVFTKL
jgi:hypothetical protein